MAKGYIYIMTNPAFPQYVKIGYADDVQERLKILNSNSGLPMPFELYAEYEVHNRLTDKALHKLIDTINPNLRLNKNREFYEVSANNAFGWLKAIAEISDTEDRLVVPSDEEAPVRDVKKQVKTASTKQFSEYKIANETYPYKSANQVFIDLCEKLIRDKGSEYFNKVFESNKKLYKRRTYNEKRSSDVPYLLTNGLNINKHGSGTELLTDVKLLASMFEGYEIIFVEDGGDE